MKKLSKILALSLVLVMVLGMTVFAEESPKEGESAGSTTTTTKGDDGSTTTITSREDGSGTAVVTDSEGNTITYTITAGGQSMTMKSGDTQITLGVPEGVTAYRFSNTAVVSATQQKDASAALNDATATEVVSFWLDGVPVDGKVTVTVSGIKLDSEGTYEAEHLPNGGSWEKKAAEANADGSITISGLTDLSPFVIYEVGDTNDNTNNNNNNNNNNSSTNNSNTNSSTDNGNASTTPTSPQTGETMPVAVMVALFALAGAAVVGTRKVIAER